MKIAEAQEVRGQVEEAKRPEGFDSGVSSFLGLSQTLPGVMLVLEVCTESKFSGVRVRGRKAVNMKRTEGSEWDDEMAPASVQGQLWLQIAQCGAASAR